MTFTQKELKQRFNEERLDLYEELSVNFDIGHIIFRTESLQIPKT